jgi:hypothetical protein
MIQVWVRRCRWLMMPFVLLVATGCGHGASVTVVSDFGTDQPEPGGRVVVSTDTGSDRERTSGPQGRQEARVP